jgi:hypothetical protein
MKELVIIIGFIAWLAATIMIVFTIIGLVPLILFFDEWHNIAVTLLDKL